jgi:hypothetical protein
VTRGDEPEVFVPLRDGMRIQGTMPHAGDDDPITAAVNRIATLRRMADESRKEERAAADARNGYECEAANLVIKLAKELVCVLGGTLAHRLTSELVEVAGWKPPNPVPQ